MSNGVENYGWKSTEGPHSCAYLAPAILKLLKQYDGAATSVCDLGAGNGALARQLSGAGYSTVVGVEYDAEGVRIARKLNPGLTFYNMGVQDNPDVVVENEGLFDAIVSTEVVEHLFSPHLLPRFAHGLARPNGLLIVSTPYHGYLKNLALSIFGKWDHHHTALWHGGHVKFWSRKTLTALLEGEGFKVIGFHGVGRAPFLWKSMVLVARAF